MSTSQSAVLLKEITSGRFLRSRDSETVGLLGRVFNNELNHLTDASPTVESGASKLPPRTSTGLRSPSWNLYEKEYSEINRTLTSALAMKWILRDDYETFISSQRVGKQLSRETFDELREYFLKWLRTPEDKLDLIIALITSDLGKNPRVATDLTSRNLLHDEKANHDVITYIAAKNHYFPIFDQMPTERREDILLGLKLATSLNIPQLVQGECVPGNLKEALILKDRPRALSMKCMEVLLDVAGAFGHQDTRGSLTMTQSVVGAYQTTFSALLKLLDGDITMRECYDSVLEHRRDLLESLSFGFSFPHAAEDRAFLRLLCIGRVDDLETATIFLDAFENLPENVQKSLVKGLNVDGINDGIAVLPYYMPGLFSIALNTHPTLSKETKIQLVASLCRFLNRVLAGTEPKPGTPSRIIEHNLGYASYLVKSDEFFDNPESLDTLKLCPPKQPEQAIKQVDEVPGEATNGN